MRTFYVVDENVYATQLLNGGRHGFVDSIVLPNVGGYINGFALRMLAGQYFGQS